MAWFKRETDKIGAPAPPEERTVKTEGIFVKCENEDCSATIYRKDLKANLNVCPTCGYHFRISSRERLQMLFDGGKYAERDADIAPTDPLEFVDKAPYADKLLAYQKKTGMLDALLTGEGGYHPRTEVFSEKNYHNHYDPVRCIRTARYKYIRNLRDGPYGLLPSDIETAFPPPARRPDLAAPRPPEELYDLEADPGEESNVIDSAAHAATRNELRGKLQAWLEQTSDPVLTEPVIPYPPKQFQ